MVLIKAVVVVKVKVKVPKAEQQVAKEEKKLRELRQKVVQVSKICQHKKNYSANKGKKKRKKKF